MSDPPYGTYAPGPLRQGWRALASRLPANPVGRRVAMLLRRFAGVNAGRPFDVDIFDSQHVRLYPYDNVCEKRIYATPQFWDAQERAALADAIRRDRDTFHFADIGANVGLYCLFARAIARQCGRSIRIIAVEPQPLVRARLECNLSLNDSNETLVLGCAVTATAGHVSIRTDAANLGRSQTAQETGGINVEGRPLADLIAKCGWPRIDAMKLDIEGAELPVLRAFFQYAPADLWPRLLILETLTGGQANAAYRECLGRGYRQLLATRLNSVLVR